MFSSIVVGHSLFNSIVVGNSESSIALLNFSTQLFGCFKWWLNWFSTNTTCRTRLLRGSSTSALVGSFTRVYSYINQTVARRCWRSTPHHSQHAHFMYTTRRWRTKRKSVYFQRGSEINRRMCKSLQGFQHFYSRPMYTANARVKAVGSVVNLAEELNLLNEVESENSLSV